MSEQRTEDDDGVLESSTDDIEMNDSKQDENVMDETMEDDDDTADDEDTDFVPNSSLGTGMSSHDKLTETSSESEEDEEEDCETSLENPDDKPSTEDKKATDEAEGETEIIDKLNFDGDISNNDEDGDSDSDALHINQSVCDDESLLPDDHLEGVLIEKAMKNNLTACNVKSILHQVITNKDVVDMVKNTIATSIDDLQGERTSGGIYEPKMTRSKMKEVIQKGKMPQVWPLTPVKKAGQAKPSFLEMQFTDDEDDEYDPVKDVLVRDSDDESASFISSQASDFGSPCPLTPSTPAQQITPSTSRDVFLSPTVPTKIRTFRADLGNAFDMVAESDGAFLEKELNDTIARRTRSRLPLTETSLLEIESDFVAPDITEDMYDTLCDDTDWQQFLSSLYTKTDITPPGAPEVHDDDANDPEYDYLGEAEHEEKDEEDYRFGRPYRIPKKEMLDLLNQLTEFMASDQEDYDDVKKDSGGDSTESEDNRKKQYKPSIKGLEFTPAQLLILQDQMRRHVQLTTQLYFLALGSEDFSDIPQQCEKHMHEVDMFRQTSLAGKDSSFNVCNLTKSLELIREDRNWNLPQEIQDIQSMSFDDITSNATDSEDEVICDRISKKNKARNKALLESQKDIFWTNSIFFYPELLPKRRLASKQECKEMRVSFTKGEDKLIVLGMDQFGTAPKNFHLLHKYLLPAKSCKQILFRVKNMTSKRAGDNPIKAYKKNKVLPENATLYHIFSPDSMIAPQYQNMELLPKWCKKYKEILEERKTLESKRLEDSLKPFDEETLYENDQCIDKKGTPKKGTPNKSTPNKKGMRQSKSRKGKQTEKKSTELCSPLRGGTGPQVPHALITSAGLFVPIRYASPTKLPPDLHQVVVNSNPSSAVKLSEIMDASSPASCNYYNTLTPDPDSTSQPLPCPAKVETIDPVVSNVEVPDSTAQLSDHNVHESEVRGALTSSQLSSSCEAPDSTQLFQTNNTPASALSSYNMGVDAVQSNAPSQSDHNLESQINLDVAHLIHMDTVLSQTERNRETVTTAQLGTYMTDQMHTNTNLPNFRFETTTANENKDQVSQNPVILDKEIGNNRDIEPIDVDDGNSQSSTKTIVAVSQNNLSRIVVTTPVPSPVNMEVISTLSNDGFAAAVQNTEYKTPNKLDDKQNSEIDLDNSGSFLTTPSSLASSCNSSISSTPKTAVEIVATLAPFYNSYLSSPASSQQSQLETTPVKKYRELVPKSNVPQPSPKQLFISPKKKVSPNVAKLKQHARAILPKGFVYETKISPTKRAAKQLKKKAQKMYQKGTSPSKLLLPKSPVFTDYPLYNTRFHTSNVLDNINNNAGTRVNKTVRATKRRISETEKMEESDDHQSEIEDGASQDESQPEDDLDDVGVDDNLEELMEASTTIRFDPRKPSQQISDTKTKAQRRKELNISLLTPDILDTDPKRDDRDTAFAQAYMHHVKESLVDDLKTYEQFLLLLCEFGKGTQSPIQLYKELCDLLKEYPILIEDFSGFLRPEEAVVCDCFGINQEYQKANEFLRKLEINFEKQPNQFQRILRCFDKWLKNPNRTGDQLKSQIRSFLKGSPILLQDFDLFFPEEKVPDCHKSDFEEVNLSDSDLEDESKFDGFEEVEIPEEFDTYRTKRCKCDCHVNTTDVKLQTRLKHCYECSLKNVDGSLYFQTSKNKLQPVRVVFHKIPEGYSPVPSPPEDPVLAQVKTSNVTPPQSTLRATEDLIDDKENLNDLSPPTSSVITDTSPLKHCSLKKAKKIKLKTDKKKPGERRFLSLNEITSPIKQEKQQINRTTFENTLVPNVPTTYTMCVGSEANVVCTTSDNVTGTVISIPDQSFINEDSLSSFFNMSKTVNAVTSQPIGIINENTSSDLLAKAFKATIGAVSSKSKPMDITENSSADILAAALREAEIKRSDVSMDSTFFRTLIASPNKTGPSASTGKLLSFKGVIKPLQSSTTASESATSSFPVNSQASYSHTVTSNLFLNSTESSVKSNFTVTNSKGAFSSIVSASTSSNKLVTACAEAVPTVTPLFPSPIKTTPTFPTFGVDNSQSTVDNTSDTQFNKQSICDKQPSTNNEVSWTREDDQVILEMCQSHGASEETFTAICNKLTDKIPAQVEVRFKTLMELLMEIHDDSEEEMSE